MAFLLALVGGCASAQTDAYEDEYLGYTNACELNEAPDACTKAAIVAEYQAQEAEKDGNAKAAARAWKQATDCAQRACDLGDENSCEYAENLREKR